LRRLPNCRRSTFSSRKSDIALGQTLKPEDMQWQTWPAANASGTFIRRGDRPEAANQVAGSIAARAVSSQASRSANRSW